MVQSIPNDRWSLAQLAVFAPADDFQVSPFYDDGKTYGTPTWIWSVVVNQRLYVRAWHGQQSRWYRSAVQQRAGRMHLAGTNYEIKFKVVADAALIAQIDQAYQAKYGQSPYLAAMIQAGPQASTLEILPRY